MKYSTQILPGIKAVGWIDCRALPRRVDISGICRMPLPILTDIHWIDFFGEADCRCNAKKDGSGYEETCTLKFLASKDIPIGVCAGFIVTDVSDRSYLIGSLEPPRPQVEVERRAGSPSGDPAGYQFEVKHTALKTLVECRI